MPARYSLSARSMTLVAEARQYSASMPVFFLNSPKMVAAESDSSEP